MLKIFDTHAHYFDKRFERELDGGADALLARLMPDPVRAVINVGTDCENAERVIAQAQRYDGMYAAIGIHPGDCHYAADPDAELAKLRNLLGTAESRKAQKIVAIGEIGLDYHWLEYDGGIPMDKKKEAYFFDAQMALAEELSMPVIIHDREAHGDCFDTVLRYPKVRGVFHSYSGSAELAKELTRRGWYISFSGTLTFKNAAKVREAAAAVPRERLLIETDAPYLAPHPHRGELNHSGLLCHTLDVLTELWNCTPMEASLQTYENAERLFLSQNFV